MEGPLGQELWAQVGAPEGVDPRLFLRSQLRAALLALEEGESLSLERLRLLKKWPFQVHGFLEDERERRPSEVEALRALLGLDPDLWVDLVAGAIAVYQRAEDAEERIWIAASLLSLDNTELNGVVTTLCHHALGLPLMVAMHAVARPGASRHLLAGHLARRARTEELPAPDFQLNRESSAFHDGFVVGSVLVMVFREYPGAYTLFHCRLGEGVEDLTVVPVRGEAALVEALGEQAIEGRERVGLDVCRARLAGSIAQLEGRQSSPSWQSLGHLVEERLFEDDAHEGFVVGERGARLLLDRLAAVALGHDARALMDLVRPASPAAVALGLYGAQFVRLLFGVEQGVSRLEIRLEQEGESSGMAVAIGRSALGQALTNTRLHLSRAGDEWWLARLELGGLGDEDQVLRPIFEGLFGRSALPVLDFDELPLSEQAVIAALLDLGYGLEDVALAVSQARELQFDGPEGSVAAATHYLFAASKGVRVGLSELLDRYEADLFEVDDLLHRAWKVLGVMGLS